MLRRLSLLALIVLATRTLPARAEKVNLTPEQLRQTATHVVTGKVSASYQRIEKAGDWNYTKYVAEVRVDQCEKGDGIDKNELLYVRYWTKAWVGRGPPPPDTSGHRGLPRDGQTIRVYLARNAYDGFGDTKDGGFNVIGANGFEEWTPPEKFTREVDFADNKLAVKSVTKTDAATGAGYLIRFTNGKSWKLSQASGSMRVSSPGPSAVA